jgi:hypothetical protein
MSRRSRMASWIAIVEAVVGLPRGLASVGADRHSGSTSMDADR